MITYGNISGAPMLVDGNNICLRSNRIIGASIFDATNERKQEWFNKMIAWIQDGKLQLNITFYPFEEVRKAYQTIADRTAVGKIVLSL
jgi:NADPH:quinone reductase-like Zn-dependent oxidoreductase